MSQLAGKPAHYRIILPIHLFLVGVNVILQGTIRLGQSVIHRNEFPSVIYNAVGVSPRYVFFMFIAEAFVYAVVGTMLGYLLSQATGRILTRFDMTGGLNMTFTSITTIYASLAVGATVFLSGRAV